MLTIYQQPIDINYMSPNKFSLTCGASSDVNTNYIKYQWQSSTDGSTNWADIPNSSAILPTVTLTQNDIPIYGSDQFFRCRIREYNQSDVQQQEVFTSNAKATLFKGRTGATATKSRLGADIWNRKANYHEVLLDPSTTGIFTGGATNIGHPTLEDAVEHIDYHNIQSALIDLATAMTEPIGSVKLTANKIDPSGAPQQTIINFSGIVSSPVTGQQAVFNAFGAKVLMNDNAIASEVRDKVFDILSAYETAGLYVVNVAKNGSEGIQYQHRDHKDHIPPSWVQNGITMTGVVASPARYGYGQWVQLGDAVSQGGKQIYHWERVA